MGYRRHPLRNINDCEIRQAVQIVRRSASEKNSLLTIVFKQVKLQEPPKALLMPYLDAESDGVPFESRPLVPRLVSVLYTDKSGKNEFESIVSLDSNAEVDVAKLLAGQHAPLDGAQPRLFIKKILEDPEVVAAIANFKLPPGFVVYCDPWSYGADKFSSTHTPLRIQAFLYACTDKHPERNQYAFPLPISPVFDVYTGIIIRIDALATGGVEDGLRYHTAPEAPLAHCVENEYYPDLIREELRRDLKPLHVVQPEGPSFTITDENLVEWQKWRFRVGFHYREGLTIHDVRYDGRKLFYRLNLSEMTVPYGDPRAPYHRKQAFDLGDAGAGASSNTLNLGCDCLGLIRYFNGWSADENGEPTESPNVICMHEQDSGIGWKHMNRRTGAAAVTRGRTLLLQNIITVLNYEYIFAWIFHQNGTIQFETRATGIVSTALIDQGKYSPWGNVVSPGVLAQNHQHLFCLRIDPMIEGSQNTLIQEDCEAVPESDEENPFGNAWKVVKTSFLKSTFADAAPEKNRVFKIVNENQLNKISGNPVGYKICPLPSQMLLASKNSAVRKRARFAEHHMWVTRYRDGDLWAGGKWTEQSLRETDGVSDYAARNEDVKNEDIVVWHTFGMTHSARVEDFPVMPVEVLTVSLKPVDFFDHNPALDVPQSTQGFNNSGQISAEKDSCSCSTPTSKKRWWLF
ncbi:hypothetical protein V494_08442 [Pseudogymnoascus sp. VKM F-4513 (FW-928)]|nr:hypothetical protein V494_08442 [Pseudogymnoascus sp. VKM F-4513 (FW-928)]